MVPSDRPLTLKEAAEWLQIHWKTLQEMARHGELPAFKLRKSWRFRLSDLRAWVSSRVISPKPSRRKRKGRM